VVRGRGHDERMSGAVGQLWEDGAAARGTQFRERDIGICVGKTGGRMGQL